MATPLTKRSAPANTLEVPSVGITRSELGDTLKRAREARGLSLDQVAQITKISPYHLEALERGTFINVPSGFYQRAQIRTYARAVALDPDVALAQLDRPSASAVTSQPAPEPEPERAGTPVLWRKRALVAVVTILGAVALGRAMGQRQPAGEGHTQPVTAAQTPPTATGNARPPSGDAIRTAPRAEQSEAPAAAAEQPADPGRAASPAPDLPRPAPASGTLSDTARAGGTSAADGALSVVASSRLAPASAGSTTEAAATSGPARTVAKPVAVAPKRPAERSEVRSAAPLVSGLVVITAPAGARVTVNGIAWGVTPLTIRYLPTGDKRIRVSKDGYAAEERAVRLAEGRSTTVELQLHRKP